MKPDHPCRRPGAVLAFHLPRGAVPSPRGSFGCGAAVQGGVLLCRFHLCRVGRFLDPRSPLLFQTVLSSQLSFSFFPSRVLAALRQTTYMTHSLRSPFTASLLHASLPRPANSTWAEVLSCCLSMNPKCLERRLARSRASAPICRMNEGRKGLQAPQDCPLDPSSFPESSMSQGLGSPLESPRLLWSLPPQAALAALLGSTQPRRPRQSPEMLLW